MRIKPILKRIRSAIANPLEELNRGERIVRYTWKLLQQGAKQLSEDSASMMAASLTYRTLFGLLPVTVVGAGAARAIMGAERFQQFLHTTIDAFGLNTVEVGNADDGKAVTLGSWLSELVTSGMSINVSALTWIGLLILIYSAIALLVDIESCFNVICRAKRGRAWLQRLPLYWFVLTFGPVLIAVGFWTDAQVNALFESYITWNWPYWIVAHAWDFIFCWFALFALYKLVPTSKLQIQPALYGSCVGTVLLLIGKASLGLYFSHAISLQHMYGSLGLVPVFMFWLYVMWLIILLGLQIAAIIQQVSDSTEGTSDR